MTTKKRATKKKAVKKVVARRVVTQPLPPLPPPPVYVPPSYTTPAPERKEEKATRISFKAEVLDSQGKLISKHGVALRITDGKDDVEKILEINAACRVLAEHLITKLTGRYPVRTGMVAREER